MKPRVEKLSYRVEVLLKQDEILKKLFSISKMLMFTNSKFYHEIKFDKNKDGALHATLNLNPSIKYRSTYHHLYNIEKKLNEFGLSFLREVKSDYIEITDVDRHFNNDEISFAKTIINTLVGKTNATSRVSKGSGITISTVDLERLDSTFENNERSVETTSNNSLGGGNKVHVDISDHNELSKIIFHFENGNPLAMLYPKYQYTASYLNKCRSKKLTMLFHFILSKEKDEQAELVYLLNVEKDFKAEYNSCRRDFMSKVLTLFECADKYKLVTEQADEINSNEVPFDVGMLYSHFSAFYPEINANPFPSTPPHDNDINNNNCSNNNTTGTCGTKHIIQTDTELNEQGVSKRTRHQQSTEYPMYANPATFHSHQENANTILQDQQAYNQSFETTKSPIATGDQISNPDGLDNEEEKLFAYLYKLSP